MNKSEAKATNGLLVKEDGSLHPVTLTTTADGSNLGEMRRHLEVRVVDVIRLRNQVDCWVDDEAGLVGNPMPNPILSVMVSMMTGYNQFVLGPGLFLSTDSDGASVSLSDEQRVWVETAHRMASQASENGVFDVRVVD